MGGYDQSFYEAIRAGCKASAGVVAQIVMAHLRLNGAVPDGATPRVLDVGCGEGWWARAFADLGCEAVGVDGPYVVRSCLVGPGCETVSGVRGYAADLARHPVDAFGQYDLTVCLEVAEHLPASRADSFVAELCRTAANVLFSAAIPGQGGVDHVNEQPPEYWARLFSDNGFTVSGALRWEIWNNINVEPWYRQNLLFCTQHPERFPRLFGDPRIAAPFGDPRIAAPDYVIHPVVWEARRQR